MGASGALSAAAVINPVMLAATAIAAAGNIYQAVQSNQQAQHAKGAAEAEQTAINGQIDQANKQMQDDQTKKAQDASQAQAQAQNAATSAGSTATRARAMSAGSTDQSSTILTGPLGAPPAPTAVKTLLGA